MNEPSSALVPHNLSDLRLKVIESEKVVRAGFRKFSRLRRKVKYQLGILAPPRLDLYVGMGTPTRVEVRGRALEDPPIPPPRVEDTKWENFVRSFRLFESDELADLEIEVRVGGQAKRTTTDAVGFFRVEIDLPEPLSPGQHVFSARPLGHERGEAEEGRFFVPSRDAIFGVISDIDDTILQTHVRSTAKMVWVTLIGNALTRLSFEGAPRLYQGLRRGGNDAPFFYVSRSAWNIHYLLEHFIRHQGFPSGPLSLRDAGLVTPPKELKATKETEATRIIERFSPLPFVLIGDSGQRDAKIYTSLSRKFPGRIRAILIRRVTPPQHALRARAVLEAHEGCPSLLFETDREAIDWCRERGLWKAL